MDGIDLSNVPSDQREAIMTQVKTQLAIANAQEILQRLSDKCLKKCITKPGTSLDKNEEQKLHKLHDLARSPGVQFMERALYEEHLRCKNSGRDQTSRAQYRAVPIIEKCLTYCMDRFIDSWNLVSRAYQTRLQQQ